MGLGNIRNHIALLVVAAAGMMWLFFITIPFEAGVSPDSMTFLSMAHHIVAGKGASVHLRMYSPTSDPLAASPPLFSVIIAVFHWVFKLDPLKGGWYLNLLLFGANLYLAGFMVNRFAQRVWPGVLTAIFLALGVLWRTFFIWIISEPMFLITIQLSLLFLWKYFECGRLSRLLAAALMTGIICLVRYPGIGFIAAGALSVFLLQSGGWTKKIRCSVFFGGISSLVLFAWLLRNYYHLHRPDGTFSEIVFGSMMWTYENPNTFMDNWNYGVDALLNWLPDLTGFGTGGIALGGCFYLLIALVAWLMHRQPADPELRLKWTLPCLLMIYAAGNFLFIVFSLTYNKCVGFIPDRYFISSFTHALMLIMILAAAFARGYGIRLYMKKTRLLIMIFFWIWVIGFAAAKISPAVEWHRKVIENGVDLTKGLRHKRAENEDWLPNPATADYYKMMRDHRAMSRGLAPQERYR